MPILYDSHGIVNSIYEEMTLKAILNPISRKIFTLIAIRRMLDADTSKTTLKKLLPEIETYELYFSIDSLIRKGLIKRKPTMEDSFYILTDEGENIASLQLLNLYEKSEIWFK